MAKRILIADDSVTIQKAFAMTFAGEDVSIASARSADEGLALAQKARPDLIIADGAMPGRTGYDLCAQVRADAALRGVPVYILASIQQPYDEARGASAGADGHLLKPWDTSAFLEKVYAAAGGRPRPSPPHRRAHHRGLAARLGDGGRLRRDQHRFVRARSRRCRSSPAPRPWPPPPAPALVAGPRRGPPGAPAMRPSLIPGMRPGAMPPGAARHHAGSPARRPGRAGAGSLPPRPAAPPVGRTMIGLPAAGVPIPGAPRPAGPDRAADGAACARRCGRRPRPIAPLSAPVAPAHAVRAAAPARDDPDAAARPGAACASPRETPAPLARTREITPPPPRAAATPHRRARARGTPTPPRPW